MRSVPTFALVVFGSPLCGALVACGSDDGSGTTSGKSGAAGLMEGSGGSESDGAGADPPHSTGGRAEATDGTAGGGGGGDPSGGRVELASGGLATGGKGEGADDAASGQAGLATGGQGTGGQGGTVGGAAGASGMAEPGGGGGALGQAGQGAAGDAAVEGLPGASSFTSFTISSQATMDWGSEPSECDPGYYESMWTFERTTSDLTWDWCRGDPGILERGTDTLSDAEAQATMNTLSLVTLSTEGDCLADADAVALQLEVDGETTLYHSDDSWCGSGPNDSNYANGLDAVRHWLECLTGVEVPDAPETLTLSTGHPPEDPPADSDCVAHRAPQQYELDIASRALSWRSCATDAETGEYVSETDGRVLDAAELEAVLDAYHQLDLGASGPCESYESPDSLYAAGGRLASVTIDGSLHLFDEAASCGGGWSGFAIGVAALAHLVDDLAR